MIVDKLGIKGFTIEQETALIAGLTLGDPLMFIGPHGTAKTALIDLLGAAMFEYSKRKHPNDPSKWLNFHVYDASKLNFEDLVGLPSPDALRAGRIEFVGSALTVWDKALIGFDEFSRQTPERQSNIMELLRSRKLMGLPTKVIWIINAMNPLTYSGTEELDEAVIDRHLFFIHFDQFTVLDEPTRLSVIKHLGKDDAPALRKLAPVYEKRAFDPDKLAEIGEQLFRLLTTSADVYSRIEEQLGNGIAILVDKCVSLMNVLTRDKNIDFEISGRRAGMLYRGLLANIAVSQSMGSNLAFSDILRFTLDFGLPIGVIDPSQDTIASLRNLVSVIARNVTETVGEFADTDTLPMFDILLQDDPLLFYYKCWKYKDRLSTNARRTIAKFKLKSSAYGSSRLVYQLFGLARPDGAVDNAADLVVEREEVAQILKAWISFDPDIKLFLDNPPLASLIEDHIRYLLIGQWNRANINVPSIRHTLEEVIGKLFSHSEQLKSKLKDLHSHFTTEGVAHGGTTSN